MEIDTESAVNPLVERQKFAWGKAVLLAFCLLVLANILVLDFVIFTEKGRELTPVPLTGRGQDFAIIEVTPTSKVKEEAQLRPTLEVSREDLPAEINFCPAVCLEVISEATASALAQITPVSIPTPISLSSELTTKEFYIPLGRGATDSQAWTELPGVEAVVDMANYPNVKSMIFEASMRIPTANGKVYAKLYNATDKHDVWYSEVWAEGSGGYRAESGEITLSSGRKLYRVMMKSTMGYEAILDSARIKILLK